MVYANNKKICLRDPVKLEFYKMCLVLSNPLKQLLLFSGSNKGENFTCVVIAVQVKALVLGKLHEGLDYMAKLMPMNEYRAAWLNQVNFSKISLVLFLTGC